LYSIYDEENTMTYAFIQDVPANAEMYAKIRAKLPTDAPQGLISHVAIEHEGGLRYVDVWASQDDWERFRDAQVEPAVGDVLAEYGLPHDHSLVTTTEVTVVDAWLGSPVPV
jgi:hypothetical protein